jgi:hypothetical protein
MAKKEFKRLRRLQEVLHAVHRQRKPFALDNWVARGYVNGGTVTAKGLERTCGTVCCAVGWGALDPELQKQGLKAVAYAKWGPDSLGRRDPVVVTSARQFRGLDEKYHVEVAICYGDQTDSEAIKRFFGVTEAATDWLFYPHAYPEGMITPAMVIERIERVIAAGGRCPDEQYAQHWAMDNG